jgi:hypothetical protein
LFLGGVLLQNAQQAHRHIVHVPTEQVEGEVIDMYEVLASRLLVDLQLVRGERIG